MQINISNLFDHNFINMLENGEILVMACNFATLRLQRVLLILSYFEICGRLCQLLARQPLLMVLRAHTVCDAGFRRSFTHLHIVFPKFECNVK